MSENVFMSIRRQKTTYFLDMSKNETVLELKKVIQGITKLSLDAFVLFDNETNKMMEDKLSLQDYGITQHSARVQNPAKLTIVHRDPVDWNMEQVEITEYSSAPELPETMKSGRAGIDVSVPEQQ